MNNIIKLIISIIFILSTTSYPANLTFPIEADSEMAVIKGVISFPSENNSFSDFAIILVGGSSAKLRSDTAIMNELFHNLGYAVINYDRRGNGKSTGNYYRPSSKNSLEQIPKFATDVAAIADAVKNDKRFQVKKVIAIGASMGGWIVPLAANKSQSIDGVVSIVGAASSVAQSDHFDYLTDLGLSIEQALGLMHTLKNDQSYNPKKALEALEQPGLWLLGELDDSNPTSADVMQLLMIKTKLDKNFTIKVYTDTDHELKYISTGNQNMDWVKDLKKWIAER